ncbi:MAG: FkbM family methyltransferase [Armatimonadota bacterium]|nr:FkbM family methyltransferase [Armatimonadota bacterium]
MPVRTEVRRFINFMNKVRAIIEPATAAAQWERATEKDLYYCCRLLLGRKPSQFELQAYTPQLKSGSLSLETLTRIFIDASEFLARQEQRAAAQYNPVLLELENFKIYVSPENSLVGKSILEKRHYEAHVTAMIQQILKPGMTFVDVGANIGYLSLVAAHAVGERGKVICFEPDQYNCSLLHMSVEVNGWHHVEIYPFAVSNKNTVLVYDSTYGSGTTSDFEADFKPSPSHRLVRALILDEVLQGEDKVHLLKLDIDGAEGRALQGARGIIRQYRPVILSEFCPQLLQDISKISGQDYLQAIIKENYTLSIVAFDGALIECGTDASQVIRYLEESRLIYVDMVAFPN